MNIRIKHWLATGTALAAIGTIAAAIRWTEAEVSDANRQRRQTTEITQSLTALRLATFEYVLNREERPRLQWHAVSARINRLIAENDFSGPEQKEILVRLRERRAVAADTFAEFAGAQNGSDGALPADEPGRRFEAQLLSRLVIGQQDSLADAFRLTELATQRIYDAQRRLVLVIIAGLGLLALITAGGSWFVHRLVLTPIIALQRATKAVAAGNWHYSLELGGKDEIGELSRHFGTMVQSLRNSFARIERDGQNLAALNEELEAFSYSVSHDLRAPLRSIDGFSLVLLEDHADKLDGEGKDALMRIRAASRRMGDLIDDQLRLSHVTRAELKLTAVDLSAMAREIADALDREHPGRHVEWVIATGLTIHADAALLRIALQNLLQNAWKFTGTTAMPLIRVGALRRGPRTEYYVVDNGVGFDMAHAHKLFGAFERLHHADAFPGTGIGLAIVQRILVRHGGAIRAEAKEGAGAAFYFSVKEAEDGSDGQDDPVGESYFGNVKSPPGKTS